MTATTADRTHSNEKVAAHIREHHATLVTSLDQLTADLLDASASTFEDQRSELVAWIGSHLVPHAEHEEQTSYRAASELLEGAAAITAMLAEHEVIRAMAAEIAVASDRDAAAAWGRALFLTFRSHQQIEDDVIVPMLDTAGVDLGAVLGLHDH